MNFEDAMKAAAEQADMAVKRTMKDYKAHLLKHEDDISPALVGALRAVFPGQIGGLKWNASIMTHRRGIAAEESKTGADLLIHVSLHTRKQKYSKGVLVQAKRMAAGTLMTTTASTELVNQCNKMLKISPSSFVFNYTTGGMRCASATKVSGMSSKKLHENCDWTSYRFFLELFRCPVGDPKITSALFQDLRIPNGIELIGEGDLD